MPRNDAVLRLGCPSTVETDRLPAVVRIAVGVAVVILAARLARAAALAALGRFAIDWGLHDAAAVVATVVGCGAFVRVVERRNPLELEGRGAVTQLVVGVAMSGAAISLAYAALWLAGVYRPRPFNPLVAALPVLLASAATATTEELVFRGLIFRISEESLGTRLAFVSSVAIFGLAHGLNPGATLVNCAAMSLAAGVAFTGGYLLTRRLWFPIGLHAGWNFAQLGVFGPGGHRSGEPWLGGLFVGPDWLTGGRFGLEGSVPLVAVGLALGALLLRAAMRRQRMVLPEWKRELPDVD